MKAMYEPGTKVRVVKYGDDEPDLEGPSIVGEVGTVLDQSDAVAFRVRATFDLPDHRRGEWLFHAEEVEVVE